MLELAEGMNDHGHEDARTTTASAQRQQPTQESTSQRRIAGICNDVDKSCSEVATVQSRSRRTSVRVTSAPASE